MAQRFTMNKPALVLGVLFLLLSVGFTAAVCFVDVQPVGPAGALVGFGSLNASVFAAFGQGDLADKVSDVLLLASIAVIAGWILLGIVQFARARSLAAVNRGIIFLFVACACAAVLYVLFDVVAINCAPTLDEGVLKPSFPSSHVLLCTTVFGCSVFVLNEQTDNRALFNVVAVLCALLVVAMPVLRVMAGAHWLTDVVAGVLFGLTLVFLCGALASRRELRGRHAR